MYGTVLCQVVVFVRVMTSTTATEETASVTSVSSPSARLLYYELAEGNESSIEELSESVGYDTDRVLDLLSVLDSQGLLSEDDGTFSV